MTLVPQQQSGATFVMSGKDVAVLQREVADLENRKEVLRKQCNLFDSLLKQKAKSMRAVIADDSGQLAVNQEDYMKLISEYDELWTGIGEGKETLEDMRMEIESTRTAKEAATKSLTDVEQRLSARTQELEKTVSTVNEEKSNAIRERDDARKEHADLVAENEKLKTETALLKETMEAEKMLLSEEKQVIAQQARDLAVKYGRLQRVAEKMGVRGV